MTDRPTCSTCFFGGKRTMQSRMTCLANPPDPEHGFAVVELDDWCGQYKPQAQPGPVVPTCSGCHWFAEDHCEKFPPMPTLFQNTRLRRVWGDEYECGDMATAWSWFPRQPSDTCKHHEAKE